MKSLFILIALLALTSCASKQERNIQEKVSKSNVSNGKVLGTTIHELIQSSKILTDAQKAELESLIATNKKTAEALTEESFKLRGVLVKELLSGKSTPKLLRVLKKDIEKVEAKRLKNTFDTVEKISKIVSKHPENEQYVDHLHMITIEPNQR